MRGIARIALVAVLGVVVPIETMAVPAIAGGRTLDDYCSPSGDYCTLVIEKASGTILFKIRAFADYFGTSEACVTKDTEVCHSRTRRDAHGRCIARLGRTVRIRSKSWSRVQSSASAPAAATAIATSVSGTEVPARRSSPATTPIDRHAGWSMAAHGRLPIASQS